MSKSIYLHNQDRPTLQYCAYVIASVNDNNK